MVARWTEMFAEWTGKIVFCIASVFIHAYIKCPPSLTDVLKATNWTFQEVDDIFRHAGGSAVYDEFVFCNCAPE
jgi:hypothetical protein